MIEKIKKRDGRIVDFDVNKIAGAIFKAAQSVGGSDKKLAEKLAKEVAKTVEKSFKGAVPSVEDVQDIVEKILIEEGHAKTAKTYILYRQKRKELREAKSAIGIEDDAKLTINALKVLEGRYLLKDEEGSVIETPLKMFRRVAHNIALAEGKYLVKDGVEELIRENKGMDFADLAKKEEYHKLVKGNKEIKKIEDDFYEMMTNLDFLPNSPTLMNAGTSIQQLAACFVLPVDDSMEKIFDSIKNTALIHQSGGGTGFSFSRLRPKGDIVKSTGGVASGPISFMKVFNAATEVIKQGGKRRGANMGILRVDHPDILDFVVAKERESSLNNFNISVGLTEDFMEAVEADSDYKLINPRDKKAVGKLNAQRVFDLIVTMAWKNGEPGIIFLDRLNNDNPTPKLGEIESTNPCGEQPLLPYESCNLGSINLSNHVKDGKVDWDKLEETTKRAVHFLDNVIDMGKYPLKDITDMVHSNRKIGLGVMGWADMLVKLEVPYDSEKGIKLAEKVMKFVRDKGKEKSVELAKVRGVFPNFEGSVYDTGKDEDKVRNATLTTIAPTGSISIIGGCSSGIEPLFAISFIRKTPQFELLEVNPLFEEVAREKNFYDEDLMKSIAQRGSIQDVEEIPESVKSIFRTAHDIKPEAHVKMQAAFQKYVDNAVSKTVNFPFSASTEDVAEVYTLAHKLGCKGVTIYRDKSRGEQVLNIKSKKKKEVVKVGETYAGGCATCDV